MIGDPIQSCGGAVSEESAPPPCQSATTRKSRTAPTLFRWTERFLAVIGLAFIVYHFGFELIVMTSGSMSPTLRGNSYDNGDRILVEKVSGWFRNPRRWEIYYFYDADGTPVAKRIMALPGETISIHQNHVFINGTELRLPSDLQVTNYFALGNLTGGRELNCGRGYFMLGDDSADSYDSRYTGTVIRSRFRGRVWCIVAPWKRVGWVH